MATTTRPAAGLMTAEAFCEFVHRPENADRYFELDEGKVIELPPPQMPHGFVVGLICRALWAYASRHGSGHVIPNDTGVVIGRDPDSVRGPDVMFVDELLTLKELQERGGYLESPPTLAVEVLSPSDRPGRVARKIAQYLRAGVRVVWAVDPEVPEVAVHRLGSPEPEILGLEDVLTGGEELPGFECRVAEFFELPGGAVPA